MYNSKEKKVNIGGGIITEESLLAGALMLKEAMTRYRERLDELGIEMDADFAYHIQELNLEMASLMEL